MKEYLHPLLQIVFIDEECIRCSSDEIFTDDEFSTYDDIGEDIFW